MVILCLNSACLLSNFALLTIIRALAEPNWINSPTQISISTIEITLLAFALVLSIITQICIRIRARGHKILPATSVATILTLIQTLLLLGVTIKFHYQYAEGYRFNTGGYGACISATVISSLTLLMFLLDVFIFRHLTKEHSLEQKKLELANFLFVCYIIFGAFCFVSLESWSFERAAEFCLITLLTIGYGNIVPVTFKGQIFMIFFTIVGLCVVGFFIVSHEDVLIQDLESSNSRSNESYQDQQDTLDPDLINELPPLPLSQTPMTNTSILSSNTDYQYNSTSYQSLVGVIPMLVWILVWWLGSAAIFMWVEGWSYFQAVYYAFVTFSGIGYGDLMVSTVAGVEFFWIFLLNAITIIAYVISFVGRLMAKKVIEQQLLLQRKRLVRRLKRRRVTIDRIANDDIYGSSQADEFAQYSYNRGQVRLPSRRVDNGFFTNPGSNLVI